MTQELKDKIIKVKKLAERGATEGERYAAKQALERIRIKNNLTHEQIIYIDRVKPEPNQVNIDKEIIEQAIMDTILEAWNDLFPGTQRPRRSKKRRR